MGGWDHTITQETIITPEVVVRALDVSQVFIKDFNGYLCDNGIPPVKIGSPLGSTAHYKLDPESKIYGDIDLQIVVEDVDSLKRKTASQVQYFWNNLMGDFISTGHQLVHPESKPGHPILKIGENQWVQVDMIPHRRSMQEWGRFRTTPQHNLKGMLTGNIFSSLAVVLTASIQHDGVQYKARNDVRLPYKTTRHSKANGQYQLITITTDISKFALDIFNHDVVLMDIENPQPHSLLMKHPGMDTDAVSTTQLLNVVVGLALSYEANNMYGSQHLQAYNNAGEFLAEFFREYKQKATNDLVSTKRDKATSAAAKWRAERDRKSIMDGLELVEKSFNRICYKYHIKKVKNYENF